MDLDLTGDVVKFSQAVLQHTAEKADPSLAAGLVLEREPGLRALGMTSSGPVLVLFFQRRPGANERASLVLPVAGLMQASAPGAAGGV
jgi:hypothetical protein